MLKEPGRPAAVRALAALLALLAVAGGAMLFAQAAWRSVVRYKTPYSFAEGRQLPSPAPAGRVVFIIVDGLRVDASRRMPFLNELRAKGADLLAAVGTPSYSRPGRMTIATGTWPEIHGATTNDFKGPMPSDNIIRAVARTGRSCRIAGSRIWAEQFAADIALCGSARALAENEGPGLFRPYRPKLEAEEEAGVAFALAKPADLTMVDFVATDAAAHDLGAASPEYFDETQRIDAMIRRIVAQVGLDNATFIVTADHGHRDLGGHGSDEPEVRSVPLVLAGAMIRPGTRVPARQIDLAPTLAALLGVPIPGGASGRVLTELLDIDGNRLGLAQNASRGQQRVFADDYARAVGVDPQTLPDDPEAAISRVRSDIVEHERLRRLPTAALLTFTALAIAALGLGGGPAWRKATLAGLGAYAAAFTVLLFATRQALTLSAINHDEQVAAFFRPFVIDSFAASLVAALVVLLMDRRSPPGRPFVPVLRIGAVLLALGTAYVAWGYGVAGLFSSWRLPSIPAVFGLFIAALQLVGVCGALLVFGAWSLLAGRYSRALK